MSAVGGSGQNKKRKMSEGGGGGGSTVESDLVKTCMPILKFIASKPDAEPFLDPVDWEELGIPDYPEVIKVPMDLGTVKAKLEDGKYETENDFAADVRRVWDNAKKYNQPGSGIYVAADALSKLFDRRMQKVVVKKPTENGSPAASEAPAAPTPSAGQKKKKATTPSVVKQVTQADKVKFATLINQLTASQIGKVVDMISKACPDALNEEDEEDLEIEVDKIDRATLLSLNQFCEQSTTGSDAKKKKK
uniref:Bromo domain-containing protein n=1 Tax=Spongospora subterranea TaxID=70186 RepID=A0A0H5R5I7_9EUKA|eukprot:CRZ09131.1 hypothetical protein [Spongospora subterranea]